MSEFPVHCMQGHRLKDVYDLPCPTCGCREAKVSMAATGQAMSSGRGALTGHLTVEEIGKSWPLIGLLEHVPPELNRQDSHGVLDRRFYRH